MNQIEVQIMGQSYLLGCPEGGEARLREAVDKVDSAMCRIRDAGKVKARDRIAVLAALNLAFDLTDRAAPAAAAPTSSPDTPNDATPNAHAQERVNQLVARIDQVLGNDGQLL
jgi:cell division protein ZapA